MAYPPNPLPTSRLNSTPQNNNHPADHNAANSAINDIVTEMTARVTGTLVTTGFSAASGWALEGSRYVYSLGSLRLIHVAVKRTGQPIPVSQIGNNVNTDVATAPPSTISTKFTEYQAMGPSFGGRVATGLFDPTTGLIQLTAVGGTGDIAVDGVISLSGWIVI